MEIKKFTSIIIIIANIGLLKAQYTAIPDNCFEYILIDTGIDTEGTLDGQVLTADITNVTGLDLGYFTPNCDVLDASGIEDFTNLELLFIGHSITTIDLSNNLQLKEITALQGNLQNINIANCEELTSLMIINNQLNNLDLSSNTNLEYLDLYSNSLLNIDLSNNLNLSFFNVAENQLTELNINNLINLESFICSNNLITNLNISNLINLTHFYANSNLINSVIFFNLPNLEGFGLYNNNLVEIDLTNLNNLETIGIGNNQLSELNLSNNLMLNSLFCSENQISHLDLDLLPLLSRIDCNSNNLIELRIQNGNNNLLNGTYPSLLNGNPIEVPRFITTNNPNLTCVFVDNIQNSQENWTEIDTTTTFVETVSECESLSITNFSLNSTSIYPNPTKDMLFIKNSNTIDIIFIKIYNMLGQQVIVKNDNFNQIKLSTLNPGIYIVSIKTKNEIINKKIIKK